MSAQHRAWVEAQADAIKYQREAERLELQHQEVV